LKKQSIFDKIGGAFNIGSGIIGGIAGIASGGIGSILGAENAAKGITSGIQQIQQANNGINSLNASVADAQSGKGQILNTGSEYQRLNDLDNPFSIRVRENSLTDIQKEVIGYFFHLYGYSLPNYVDSPKN